MLSNVSLDFLKVYKFGTGMLVFGNLQNDMVVWQTVFWRSGLFSTTGRHV